MNVHKPNRVARTYTQHLAGDASRVFSLLCPVREAEWIDGWEPLLVLSESGVAEPDCVFVTQDIPCDAVWYVTRHEPDRRLVEMLKIVPELTVCKLTIEVVPAAAGCAATITYCHTSLGPPGDALIDSFSQENYERFMRDWEGRMNHFLTHGEALRKA